jgi:regulator of protease activity HflC (stomatin/prohibitin superfamily)
MAAPGPALVLTVLSALLALLAVAAAVVHVVGEHERLVVLRFGRVVRVGGPGLTLLLPLVERPARVSLRRHALEAVVPAQTRDGVDVRVDVTASYRVVDPVRQHLAHAADPGGVEQAVESVVRTEVERHELAVLAATLADRQDDRVDEVNRQVAELGVRVDQVAVTAVDLSLSGGLLRWAEHLAQQCPVGSTDVVDGAGGPRR